jgi:hypothetical protein
LEQQNEQQFQQQAKVQAKQPVPVKQERKAGQIISIIESVHLTPDMLRQHAEEEKRPEEFSPTRAVPVSNLSISSRYRHKNQNSIY